MMAPSSKNQPKGLASSANIGSQPSQLAKSIPPSASSNQFHQDSSTTQEAAARISINTSRPQSLCENFEAETGTNTTRDPNNTDTEPTDAEGDNEDMPKGRPQPIRRDADISIILNPVQRADLNKLVEGILTNIETQIMKPFNFLHVPVAQANRVQIWDFSAAVAEARRKKAAKKAAEEAAGNTTTTGAAFASSASASSNNKASQNSKETQTDVFKDKDEDKIRIDVNSVKPHVSSMSGMKDENVNYFNKWKAITLKRISDLVVYSQPNSGIGASRQGQGAPRGDGAGVPANNQQQQVNKGIAYQADLNLIRRFPPVETLLCHLPVDKRRLLIHAMILVLLSTEHYISYNRLFLLFFASSLHIPASVLIEEENRIAGSLGKIYKTLCEQAEMRELEEKKKAEENQSKVDQAQDHDDEQMEKNEQKEANREAKQASEAQRVQEAKQPKEPKRKWRPSGNPIQTGKMLLAAGIGSIDAAQGLPTISFPPATVTHLIGPLGDCELAIGLFFGVKPNRPAPQTLEALVSNLQDGALIALHSGIDTVMMDLKAIAPEDRRMRKVICVDGLLTDCNDITGSWKCLGHHNEILVVRYEIEALQKVGNAFHILQQSRAWPTALKELSNVSASVILRHAAWPESLMRISKIVDNPWSMAVVKCNKVTQVLHETIVGHVLGERGITLIGHGLGARAIYTCLLQLAERKQYGLVDSVVLMGAPIPSDAGVWSAIKAVVSGRVANCYSPVDYMLAFASRLGYIQGGIAGVSEIKGVGGIENYDCTRFLTCHRDYPASTAKILAWIGWDDLKEELKAPPAQPKMTVAPAQKVSSPAPGDNKVAQGPDQVQNPVITKENKEAAPAQRGGKATRGGGRGGSRIVANNTDKRLADQMGKMNL